MSLPTFHGKTVAVTGGTGALGASVVRRLLDAGATIHVTWILEEELDRFELKDHDRVTLHKLDCADERAVRAFYQSLPPLWASIHLVGGFAMTPAADTSLDDFKKMYSLNTFTSFLCSREAVRKMRYNKMGGRIVNVGSRPAVLPTPGMIAYSSSKAAVCSLTQSLAEEVKPDGILVNAVLPSIMDTPANRAAMPDADHKSWPKTDEVAEAIAFLASTDNTLTSGALLPVYGKA